MKITKPFQPFIAAGKKLPEFTLRATILGILLGIFFNVGNTYLGLRVGMTVSASIPAAVLSMAILHIFFKDVSILENNIVQTIASVGEGLAAGIIFTIPAIFLLGGAISNMKIFILAFLGGILGILFMIPMRRYIIVKEHGILPFPEGTACAEILKAGASQMQNAVMAIWGILVGALYGLCTGAFHLWHSLATFVIKPFEATEFRMDGSPALLGVGYIIGTEIAAITFAGGALGWWGFIPIIKLYASHQQIIFPGTVPITEMNAVDIWSNYVRYIGIGTVAVGGIYNLFGILPMILRTFHIGFKELFSNIRLDRGLLRTDTDISMRWLILGSIGIILLLWLIPGLNMNLFTIVLLVILGYFFVAVTSITVGIVGSSSNPASGMVLTTLLITCSLFVVLGWTERIYLLMAITMGAVVTVAICLAATTSQDLKTGFLLGATPQKQQIAEMLGLIFPSIIIGSVLILLNQVYGFGTTSLPAPQAALISVISSGILQHELPSMLVLLGIVLGLVLLLLRTKVLPFAIGLYLPLEITTPLMLGGIVRFIVKRIQKQKEGSEESGILIASGLVAGDACIGVVIALLTVIGVISPGASPLLGSTFSIIFFLLLALFFGWFSLRPSAKQV